VEICSVNPARIAAAILKSSAIITPFLSLSECKIYIYIYFACTFLFKKYIYKYIFLIKTTFDLPKFKTVGQMRERGCFAGK